VPSLYLRNVQNLCAQTRPKLVTQRRSYAARIAAGSANDEQVAEAMVQIFEIQQCIRAIDEAIIDEQQQPEQPRERPGLQVVVDKGDPPGHEPGLPDPA
jgi:hypothetical protein